MKTIALLGLSILGAAALVACGGNGGDGDDGAADGDGGAGGVGRGSTQIKSSSSDATSTHAASTSATTGSGAGGSGGLPAMVNAVFPPTTNDTDFMTMVVASPWVDGINPHLAWSTVDKGPNAPQQYQWTDYDASIKPFFDAAKTYGKKVNIIVYAIGYTDAELAPSYVTDDAALDKVDCSEASDWPVVYEAPFKSAYKAFISEVLAHYANNPLVGYIRRGLSRGGEVYPFCADQEMALVGETNMNTWLNDYWAKYDKEMLDYEEVATSHHANHGALHPVGESGRHHLRGGQRDSRRLRLRVSGPREDRPRRRAERLHRRLVRALHAVQGSGPARAPADRSERRGRHAHDASSCASGDSACKNQAATGPLPPLIDLGLEYHATIFEIYADDLLLALDSNPNLNNGKGYCNSLGQCYAQYGAAYTAALKKVHGH